MELTQQVLLKIPSVLLCLIMVGSAVILSIVGLLIVRHFIPHHRLKLHNDVAGPLFGTLGTVYAVLLAFIVVTVWQNFDKSNLNVKKEADCLIDLYIDAEAFSPSFKEETRALLNNYANVVVNDEWSVITKGELSPRAQEAVRKLCLLYSNYLPKNSTELTFFQESVRHLNELGELRLMRLMDSRTGIHPLLWFVLIFGGVVTITFTFFFGTESLFAQMVMAVLLAIIISLVLFTILSLDYPFTGDIRISSEPFKLFLKI